MEISEVVNNEELKHLCLKLLLFEEDETACKVLSNILTYEFVEKNIEFTTHDIVEQITELIKFKVIENLHKKGLIETTIDENGKEHVDSTKLMDVFKNF